MFELTFILLGIGVGLEAQVAVLSPIVENTKTWLQAPLLYVLIQFCDCEE